MLTLPSRRIELTYSPQSPVDEAGERDSHALCRLAAILLGRGRSGSGRSVGTSSAPLVSGPRHGLSLQSSPSVSCERSRRPGVLSGVGGGGGGCGAWRSSCALLASNVAAAGRGKGSGCWRDAAATCEGRGGCGRWRLTLIGQRYRTQACPTTSASPSTPAASSEPVELLAAHPGEAGALHAGRLAPGYSMLVELEPPLSLCTGGTTSAKSLLSFAAPGRYCESLPSGLY
eukprot:scaffold7414_cov61-Phaeocystis_antarctica.AAC.2